MREAVASEIGDDALFADGFDGAIIGFVRLFDREVALYDVDKVIGILVADGMSESEAMEYFEFNILGAWHGEKTPAYARILA